MSGCSYGTLLQYANVGEPTIGRKIVACTAVNPAKTIASSVKIIEKISRAYTENDTVTRAGPAMVSLILPVAEALTSILSLEQIEHLVSGNCCQFR